MRSEAARLGYAGHSLKELIELVRCEVENHFTPTESPYRSRYSRVKKRLARIEAKRAELEGRIPLWPVEPVEIFTVASVIFLGMFLFQVGTIVSFDSIPILLCLGNVGAVGFCRRKINREFWKPVTFILLGILAAGLVIFPLRERWDLPMSVVVAVIAGVAVFVTNSLLFDAVEAIHAQAVAIVLRAKFWWYGRFHDFWSIRRMRFSRRLEVLQRNKTQEIERQLHILTYEHLLGRIASEGNVVGVQDRVELVGSEEEPVYVE